jgi:hypothetical protein
VPVVGIEAHRSRDKSCHTTRKRGIQYAALYQSHHYRFGILDRPLSRTMTVRIQISNSHPSTNTASRSRRGFAREFCLNFPSPDIRGRRECRALDAPAASCVVKKQTHERSHHGHTGNHPAFPAQWFYGLLRALPGDQACLTPSPALLIADLTPASGRQNHTTSPYASALLVKHAARVHRIPPRVDDVAQRPSEGRDRIAIVLICPRRQAKF